MIELELTPYLAPGHIAAAGFVFHGQLGEGVVQVNVLS
jgi:lipid-binding SYLF domain-containing protein